MSLLPPQFLGLPPVDLEQADALILPLPLEKTVSYGTGTRGGPRAILEASRQIELFDEETLVDFAERPKLCTLPPLLPAAGRPAEHPNSAGHAGSAEDVQLYLETVRRHVAGLGAKFLVALGGEHTVSYGVIGGLVQEPAELTIVQIDAHADLIDALDGRHWSHGTVMRRLWERGCRLIGIGIRSLSRSEYELTRSAERITTFYAHELGARWQELLATLAGLEGKVYVTIDVDGLDPAVIPSTGTPQPGGLTWRQMMELLAAVAGARRSCWVGADVVEFVPSPAPPGCDPAAARLVMKVLAWWTASRGLANE
jgi:agmatinase